MGMLPIGEAAAEAMRTGTVVDGELLLPEQKRRLPRAEAASHSSGLLLLPNKIVGHHSSEKTEEQRRLPLPTSHHDEWMMDPASIPQGCLLCNFDMEGEELEECGYLHLDDSSHLLHAVVHANGYGHLLRVNGREGGTRLLTGRDIMSFWDRLCNVLHVRKVTVMDISKKHGMD